MASSVAYVFILACICSAVLCEEGLITFVTGKIDGAQEVATIAPEGLPEVRVIPGTRGMHTSTPRLSHSQKEIVFSSDLDSEHPLLYVVPVDGSESPRRLTTLDPERYVELAAEWASDDSMLVMEYIDTKATGHSQGHIRIAVVSASGDKWLPLMTEEIAGARQGHNDFFAEWHPEGHSIIFLSDRDSFHPEFYLLDLIDETVIQLGHLPPTVHYPLGNAPAMLPDGSGFIYEEEMDDHAVNMVQVNFVPGSRDGYEIDFLFSPRVVKWDDGRHPVDLDISQVR